MPLFDVYIAVDFSGSKHLTRQRHSIAFAKWERGFNCYVRKGFTRSQIVTHILQRVIYYNLCGKRILFGFDFQYSFSKGLWSTLTGLPETWTDMLEGMANGIAGLPPIMEELESNARQWADAANQQIKHLLGTERGPFWGPNFSQAKDPKFQFFRVPFEEFRVVEKHVRSFKPIFKIGGQGAVGLQSLCGMPHLFNIRNACSQKNVSLHCWPFDGWDPKGSTHCFVEWYPAIQNKGQKSDEEDALACVKWAKIQDDNGNLANYFKPPISDSERAQVAFEGWVLGIM